MSKLIMKTYFNLMIVFCAWHDENKEIYDLSRTRIVIFFPSTDLQTLHLRQIHPSRPVIYLSRPWNVWNVRKFNKYNF